MAKANKKLIPFYVILIAIIAFVVRTAWLKDSLFFGWEQGRDFLKLNEIATGDQTLVGPKTDIDGVFHGALSYYIPYIPYLLFGGNPYLVLLSYIALNSLTTIVLYQTTKEMFSKRVASLAILLYAVSYSSIIYARWLSNPNLVPSLTIFFLYFLWKSKKNWKYLFASLICWFIIFHFMIVVALSLVLPSLLFIKMEKIKLSLERLALLVGFAPIMLSSYLLFELKNDFLMTRSFLGSDQASGKFWLSGISFIDQFINEVVDGIFSISPRLSFIVFMTIIIYLVYNLKTTKRSGLVLTFLFSTPILFLFVSNSPLRHFFITVPIFLSLVIAVVIDKLLKDRKRFVAYLLTLIVIVGNLITISKRLPESEGNFIHHAQRTYLGDMKKLIDYVYEDANGKEFTYDYYSVPYWKEDAWIYLFQWYGKGKYGYAPSVDRTNVDRSEMFYTFIEPNETTPVHLDNWYGEYKKDLELIDTFESGRIRVEKRTEKE